MSAWSRVRWWVLAVVLVVPIAALMFGMGLSRADQLGGAVGLFVGMVGCGASLYSAWLAREQYGRPEVPAIGGLIVPTTNRQRRRPVTPESLVLQHWEPARSELWAVPPRPSAIVGGRIASAVAEPADARYSHAATAYCTVCSQSFEYRRLSDSAILATMAEKDRRVRVSRRLCLAGAVYFVAIAVGLAVTAAAGAGVAIVFVLVAVGLLAKAWRTPAATAQTYPHVILPQPGYPKHTVTQTS